MDGHAEPVSRLFAGHLVNALGDLADALKAGHGGEGAEEQGQGEGEVLVEGKGPVLALLEGGDADAGVLQLAQHAGLDDLEGAALEGGGPLFGQQAGRRGAGQLPDFQEELAAAEADGVQLVDGLSLTVS